MELNREIYRAARLARDPRFDGKFFVAVRTTSVFCRPVCPARSPREENIDYYPSAAAALGAGFRPCLRCRPESWGTPVWDGTSTTVIRALRLIDEGAMHEGGLESGGVDVLAARLGIGSRHLRRLFLQHLGATPIAVAQAQRLLSAKKLIDETTLPLTAIAIASRYGSIRRFNAAFLSTYGRSPRELRRGTKLGNQRASSSGSCTLQLRFRPPYDYDALLHFLAKRAIAGVEYIRGDVYRRSFVLDGQPGWLEVQPHALHALAVRVELVGPARLLQVVARVRRIFDLDADPLAIHSSLKRDPLLTQLTKERPGLRVPGAWDGFELGVRAILGQQVSVAGASTLTARLAAKFGHPVPFPVDGLAYTFPTADELAGADLAIGIPASRAEAIREFARTVVSGALVFDGSHDAATFAGRLCAIRGLGPWTAQYIAMRALSDPDAFPAGDLVLLRATGMKTTAELEHHAERWRPWRAYAAMHIWQGVHDGTIGNLLHMDGKPHRKTAAGGG